MKIRSGGFTIEAREVIGYDIHADRWIIRYDTQVGWQRFGLQAEPLQASELARITPAELEERLLTRRAYAAHSFEQLLEDMGIDPTRCATPPMPEGWKNPEWVK